MDKLKIIGKANLSGSIDIPGAKNAALPIMICSLLSKQKLHLNNIPNLVDIHTMKKLLESLGIKFKNNKISLTLIPSKIEKYEADYNLVRKMRASILVLGPLLSRYRKAKISLPGGCAIGTRPIDIHLFGLEKLGATFSIKNGYVLGKAKDGLIGNTIKLPSVSVGATSNIMMAAVLAKGKTKIINAAREPEIEDLASCLNKMGAKINGAGSSIIEIEGVAELKETKHFIIPDRIVAGTYIIAAIMLNKKFIVKKIKIEHLQKPLEIFDKMGANFEISKESITIKPSKKIKGIKIETNPYPGFPTDLQAQTMTLMSIAQGKSEIKEKIFENRFMHVPELNRLGGRITLKNDTAYIKGSRKFKGAQVMASDLRASVSLVLAGMCADGQTIINRVYHLDRGYEKIEKTLGNCGPKIIRLK
jgi:UDP-N-acetylglucosamine 1-carboxyvinyltransferase